LCIVRFVLATNRKERGEPCVANLHIQVVLSNIPEIPYTAVFSSNPFKGIDFQIYQLCWHRYIVLWGKPSQNLIKLCVDGLDVTTRSACSKMCEVLGYNTYSSLKPVCQGQLLLVVYTYPTLDYIQVWNFSVKKPWFVMHLCGIRPLLWVDSWSVWFKSSS